MKSLTGASPGLVDGVDVAAKGRAIDEEGIRYVVDGLLPDYGVLGFLVAAAKVGKTTLAHALGAAVANDTPFLGRDVEKRKVLVIAAEDPPEYVAWLARHLQVAPGAMGFYQEPIRFDDDGLGTIATLVKEHDFGLVLVSSWQAVIVGLVRDENDNAGAVAVVECVKQAARVTGVPWLIDAHSGKGEDQSEDADPTKALRGASAAAGAADFMLSVRFANGPFSSRRRLSGKGRFVSLEPMLLDFDISTSTYSAISDSNSAFNDTTWHQILESGILQEWASVDAIATAIGAVSESGRVSGHGRRKVSKALHGRSIDRKTEVRRSRPTTLYRLPKEQQ